MIPKLNSRCRTTETNTASDNLLMAFNKQTFEGDNYIGGLFTNLQTWTGLLGTAIYRGKVESNLDELDVARDEKVQALNYLLLGATHHPIAEIKAAGENLFDTYMKYGLKIINETYAIESSLIESLLQDLSAPVLQADITAVSGCTEVIADLQAAQNNFKVANFAWEEEKAKEGLTESATQIKKEVVSIINDKIVVYLRAMQQANGAVYGELAQTVSQIISDANQAIKRRAKKDKEVAIEN
ncbi:DUF6261 family protein [Ancylomarina sp.]|uniref:DUF6261 family protein n=1 Tax=Ancylomarina sp. TaxID=1970196 RepID=UPI003564D551